MENDNLRYYNKLRQPPKHALKSIQAGRLKGKSDISPQWRYEAMTGLFGPCGVGWRYEIVRLWNEPGSEGQVFAFAEVNVYVRVDGEWSAAIPGIGGSMLVEKEKAGLHASDEGYKMATTDALSVAMKMLGVAGDVYAGFWDGSKYNKPVSAPPAVAKRKTVADYQQEIDKCRDVKSMLQWMTTNKTAIERDLHGQDRAAFKSYCQQLLDAARAQEAPRPGFLACPDGKGNVPFSYCEEEKCINIDACQVYQAGKQGKTKND